jgi:hypothetical protein
MVLIKVQYDAYDRRFKILDQDLKHFLKDGETYVLVADVSINDLDLKSVVVPPDLIPLTA